MTDQETEITRRLELAINASSEAADLILRYYQTTDLDVELKSDRSPVTVADRGAEELLRERISAMFPNDGILGEELGETESKNGFVWILDPIDGTKSFIHGVPLFGTLIGIEFEKQIVAGVCRFPALHEVVYAKDGGGAWWKKGNEDPQQVRVTETDTLADALFCTTTVTGWDKIGRRDALDRLCSATRLTRGWGDCYGHILVATGRADVMVDPELNPWDCAALVPIAKEAGGEFVDWNGVPSIYNGNGFTVNGKLKNAVLGLLKSNP